MSNLTITIVGAGLIGTSLGLALKQLKETPQLLAHDKDLSIAKDAVKKGAFDKAEWNLVNACEKAEVIILAIPLSGIRSTLEAIAPYLKQGAIISDTSRTKAPVLAWAHELLPDHAHFVGGDPVVYPAGSGREHATPDLFRERLYCLTPTASANEEAVQFMVSLVSIIGAQPFFVDADEHDGLVTATEYLPTILSTALVNTVAGLESWRETRKLAGTLFEQVSAAASGDPDSLKDSLLSHRQNMLSWLDRYIAELRQLRALLVDDEDAGEVLAQKLDKAVVERRNWLTDFQQGTFADPELTGPDLDQPGMLKRLIGFGR